MRTKGLRLTVRPRAVLVFGALAVLLLSAKDSFSQTAEQAKAEAAKRGRLFLTKKEILEGAKKEGRLVAVPGFDEASFPLMKKTFAARRRARPTASTNDFESFLRMFRFMVLAPAIEA